jgi:hypothetical protein
MALDESALSELLAAFRAGDGVDLIRDAVRMAMQEGTVALLSTTFEFWSFATGRFPVIVATRGDSRRLVGRRRGLLVIGRRGHVGVGC